MKRFILVLMLVVLIGCSEVPLTLDTSSQDTISSSVDAMLEQLTTEEQDLFRVSITNCYMILGIKHFGETKDPQFAANQKMNGMTVEEINNLAKELLN